MSRSPIPAKALAQHTIALGKTGSGKSSKMRVIVEGLLEAGDPVCIVDPKGDWWGIKSSADGKRPGFPVVIFGGEHADVPLNAHAGAQVAELIATGNRPSLIDLGGWMVGERTRFWIDFASTFFRSARGRRHLVIDEVHNFAPQGKVLDVDAGKALHWSNRLASEGRGKGITLIAASQRPQKVHKDFVTSCETLIACRVIHKLDRDAIKDWIDGCADPEKGREVLQTLAQMKRDEAWVWSPEVDFGPVRTRWQMFATYDSFAPQSAGAGRLKGWAGVDLEDVKGKLAGLVEEADRNDPAKLKARIRELEREVAKAPAVTKIDATVVKAAEQAGYEAGHAAGQKELKRTRDAEHKQLRQELLRAVNEVMNGNTPIVTVPAPPLQVSIHPSNVPPATRDALVDLARAAQKASSNGAGEKLSKADRLILTVLAQYPHGRTKVQAAILTGYAHNGGGFNNALSGLRSRDYLTGAGDRLTITAAGLKAVGDWEPLPTGAALLEHWQRQLSKAECAALNQLAEVYPRTLTKSELAERSGYEADGGGFNNALSRLRTLELISGRGELRASEALF